MIERQRSAEEMEHRLLIARRLGFEEEAVAKIVEAIDLPNPERISQRIADLQALGLDNPIKTIASSPALTSYSYERLAPCADILARTDDAPASALLFLITKRREAIAAVAADKPTCWPAVRALVRKYDIR